MKALKLLTIGFFVFGATILAAETLPIRGPLPFSTYDKDNNNVITSKEFNIIKKQRMDQKAQMGYLNRNSVVFSDVDLNSDGEISPQELKVHQENSFYYNRMNPQNVNMNNRGMDFQQNRVNYGMRQGRGNYGMWQMRGNCCMWQMRGNCGMGPGRGNW